MTDFELALDRAIGLITPREHSELELRNKLLQRKISPDVIDAVIEKLRELDYISDERFTETYIQQRIRRGDGPRKIAANLQKRGINRTLIESSIPVDDDFWLARAHEVYRKRHTVQHEARVTSLNRKEWLRMRRFLESRGFGTGTVLKVLGVIPRK